MKTLLLLATSLIAFAQTLPQGTVGDVTYIAVPYTEFCGASACNGGVFVHLNSTGSGFDAYRVTVRVRTDTGNDFTVTQLQDRTASPGWTNVQFRVGRVQAVLQVTIRKLNSVGDSITISH